MPLLEDFAGLFRGRDDVWGSVEGRSNKEQVTDQHYKLHLEGKRSLGIYPLLDSGMCHFFAVDLDDNDFKKARGIRDALYKLKIPVYIAQSKSKGWHVYGFCDPPGVIAADIRWVLFSVMEGLGFTAEVFPKQDKLDEVTRYGNYINLPCFGKTRLFHSKDQRPIPTAEAIKRILPATAVAIAEAKAKFPPPPTPYPLVKVEKPKKKKGVSHPPCIVHLMKGVTQGMRDEAAFALARHHLDQGYLPEEVFNILLEWDTRNRPPVGDMRILQAKVQSAQKGYAFGCASIKDEPLLSQFCVGETQCTWLTEQIKEKKKKGLLVERSFYDTADFLFEEIVDITTRFEQENPRFLACHKQTGEIKEVKTIDNQGVTIVPAFGGEAVLGAILLPTGVDAYGSVDSLVKELATHITKYLDLPPLDIELCAWYIVMTWGNDQLFTVPYLRFRGDTGTGKSRCLDVVGRLCYKPLVVSGAITPAPIYRIITKYGGTVILDEADFSDSSEKSEVVTILNCGFETGRPVLRCVKDEPGSFDTLASFGPKCLATRFNFKDIALEGRCLTIYTTETDRDDIPAILGKRFRLAQSELRKKLLAYRFANFPKMSDEDIEVEDIDIGHVEPRLRQTGLPLAVSLRRNPEALDKFKDWLQGLNQRLVSDRGESPTGRVVVGLFKAAQQLGRDYVTPGAVQKVIKDELNMDITPQRVGKILSSLKVERRKKRLGTSIERVVVWDLKMMKKLARRYISDIDEYVELLEEEEAINE
jgi:hypothetical protein